MSTHSAQFKFLTSQIFALISAVFLTSGLLPDSVVLNFFLGDLSSQYESQFPQTPKIQFRERSLSSPPCNRKLHEIWNFYEIFARPIRSYLLPSPITFTVALHLLVGYGMEDRFASHMSSISTVGTTRSAK
ncbi:hypothetical protein TNCV_638581 [Trichonephila clavipes]|nr:hypothetical protein TNCV_638581 [Trichonephila clavipes]